MNVRNRLLLSVALSLALVACKSGNIPTQVESGTDTVDASLPTQLPRTAIPSHYAITVTPHADKLTFDGTVAIDLKVIKPTTTLTLNAADLTFGAVSLKPANGQPMPAQVSTDAEAQTATFTFDQQLQPGDYQLNIAYAGKINTQANGLFALDYTNVDGKPARALFTQFEAPDARRFVPSWDEPDYKARFDLTARVPKADLATSNMPEASSRDIEGGLKEVTFGTTPVMSTYLLFFSTGDMERISKKVGDHEVGIVVSRGNTDKVRFALDAEAQILPYYNDYFGTPYPLPKLDNVAGPGQSQFFGAMENWGAIFTFDKILVLDPAISSEADRQAIYSVEAHEMAHQWFGDLVTMAWWDDLWLNEGFASWMANKTTKHFQPEWGADVAQIEDRETAMALDSFAATHPIVQNIRTVEQINQAFDDITYEKGQTVISMLEGFAGEDVWRKGIRDYMRKFAYKNTRTADLWAAVEGAGAKGLVAVARDFTSQPGIPLIQVGPSRCVNGQTQAILTQSQFSNDRREEVTASPLSWRVPVRASAGSAAGAPPTITQGRTTNLSVPGCGVLLLNPGQTGYYRVLYTPEQLQALQRAFPNMSAVDQFGLLADQLALSTAGYQPVQPALDLLASVPADGHAKVVNKALSAWVELYDRLEGNPAAQANVRDRAIAKFWPRLQALGFTPRQGEPPLDALLRPELIAKLGYLGDPRVAAEGKRLFAAWQKDPKAIPGSLKATWLAVIARNATSQEWDALHRIAQNTRGTVERITIYELLGAAKDKALAQRALALALSKEPGPTVSPGIIRAVAENHPAMAIDYITARLDQFKPLVDISASSRFIAQLGEGSGDQTLIPKLQAYANANIKPDNRRPIEQAVGKIRWRASITPRIAREAVAWLQAHPAPQRA